MIKSIIFDLYGTLLYLTQDSQPFLKLARQSSALNIHEAIKLAMTKKHPTLQEYVELLKLDNEEELATLETKLQDDLQLVKLYPDTLRTLKALKENNIKTTVISNLATPYQKPFVRHDLNQYFDATVFSCECGFIKPDPKIYQLALQKLGSLPHETMMVGDSLKSDVDSPSNLHS